MRSHKSALMRLRIFSPTRVVLEHNSSKIIAEAADGMFCLLPRHVDFLAQLPAGVLSLWDGDGLPHYCAIDHAQLVKCGADVSVAAFDAVPGQDLKQLRDLVEERFLKLDDNERQARSALARLEAGTLRSVMRWEVGAHGR